jgi:hypothetical protein
MAKKTKISDGSISLREFARRQRVSHVAVQGWVSDGLPTIDGRIDPKAGAAWVRKYRRLAVEAAKHGELTLAEALRRKEVALMGIRELELVEKSGQVVSIEDAVAHFGAAISICRARLLQIPTASAFDLAQESDPKKVEKILQGLVRDALNELALGAPPSPEPRPR